MKSQLDSFDLNAVARHVAALEPWFIQNQRPLPWRQSKDPYRIWISEVMLQQTTVKAVIPYYEKFLVQFPTVAALANSPIERVLQMWAGLGYYSRARNLHRAATAIHANGFPKTFNELLNLPGFGPYTARAVASLAFDEQVGILDGNVFRVLSRLHGLGLPWWQSTARQTYQQLADAYAVQATHPSNINQGLMELGATICTPDKPACLLCPVQDQCVARATDRVNELPLTRPRRATEVWVWKPEVRLSRDKKLALVKNDYAPFLRGHWILPGTVKKQKLAPKDFRVRHSVTHHAIFVQPTVAKNAAKSKDTAWIALDELQQIAPSSLIQKILKACTILSVAALIGLSHVGCGSPTKTQAPASTTPFVSQKEPQHSDGAIVTLGSNEFPRFSTTGERLYFTSRRGNNPAPQIYEMDMASRTTRRLTYQSGRIHALTLTGDGKLLYSSDTEQVKNFSVALKHFTEKSQPESMGQIFELDPSTSILTQLTNEMGFQSDPVRWADGTLIFHWQQGNAPARLYRQAKSRILPVAWSESNQMTAQVRSSETPWRLMWLEGRPNQKVMVLKETHDFKRIDTLIEVPFAVTTWRWLTPQNVAAFIRADDGALVFWDLPQKCWRGQKRTGDMTILSLDIHPSQPLLAVAARDGGGDAAKVYLWDYQPSPCTGDPSQLR
jgi:A/G-specific adenine glycosylase